MALYKRVLIDCSWWLRLYCRYIQYDSWFYRKSLFVDAVLTWDAMPSVFPHGMQ